MTVNNKNRYLFLDGNGDYAEVADNDAYSIPTTGALTISFRMRPDVLDFPVTIASADGPYINFIGKGDYLSPTQYEWEFRMYNKTGSARPNRISFYVFNIDAGIGVGSFFEDTVIAGSWIRVTGKVDSTSTYMYKNGTLRDNDVYSGTITPANGIAPLRIGTVALGDPSFFQGALDDVIIWNRALSDAEVMGLEGDVIPSSGLVSRWRFDEGSGSTATDDVGGHSATLNGNAVLFDTKSFPSNMGRYNIPSGSNYSN